MTAEIIAAGNDQNSTRPFTLVRNTMLVESTVRLLRDRGFNRVSVQYLMPFITE